MKKQNQMNKLAFGKATVTELNQNQLIQINGGKSGIVDTCSIDEQSRPLTSKPVIIINNQEI